MKVQQKLSGRATSIPTGLAAGAAISVLVTFLVCVIGAWLISSEIIPQKQMGYCSVVALMTAAVLGAITAWRKIQRKRFAVCFLSGGVYYLILIGITILFFNGDFRGMGVTFAVIFLGSLTAILLTNKTSKSRVKLTHKKFRR